VENTGILIGNADTGLQVAHLHGHVRAHDHQEAEVCINILKSEQLITNSWITLFLKNILVPLHLPALHHTLVIKNSLAFFNLLSSIYSKSSG